MDSIDYAEWNVGLRLSLVTLMQCRSAENNNQTRRTRSGAQSAHNCDRRSV